MFRVLLLITENFELWADDFHNTSKIEVMWVTWSVCLKLPLQGDSKESMSSFSQSAAQNE